MDRQVLFAKKQQYVSSARVPLAISGPGVPVGKTVDALTLLLDIAPTLAELASVPVPAFVDGRSLVPWFNRDGGLQSRGRQRVLHEFWPHEGFPVDEREEPKHVSTRVPEYRAVRTRRYLYTEYRYPDGTEEVELYDVARDPFELTNIAHTADAALLASLSSALESLQDCEAAECRAAEGVKRGVD